MNKPNAEIKIEEIDALGDRMFFARGHVDKGLFLDAVKAFGVNEGWMKPEDGFGKKKAEYDWFRAMPPNYRPEYDVFYESTIPESRGSFRVTFILFREPPEIVPHNGSIAFGA